MVRASFQAEDQLKKARFFQETFLLANISVEVVLRILFFTLSNADIQFDKKKLTCRSYTTAKTLPTTKQVEIIDKKKFTKVALDENVEAFLMQVTFLSLSLMTIYLAREVQIPLLLFEKVEVLTKYSDFSNVFSEEKVLVFLWLTKLN